MDAARPSKKVCLGLEDTTVTTSHLFKLPLEILGHILILTGSPRHVLAFARTSKRFCYTLISEGAQYIWRQARRGLQCSFLEATSEDSVIVPHFYSPPDPPKQFFSEAAYAAFLFDPGSCDNCGKQTFEPYASFALRIRLCNKPACRHWPDGFQRTEDFLGLVPTNEISQITARYAEDVLFWPHSPFASYRIFRRQIDFDEAFETDERSAEELESLRRRNQEWMKFCSSLAQWKIAFNEKYCKVKAANEEIGRQASDDFGWDYTALMNCTVFGQICQRKSRFLENVNIRDVYPLRDQIESELLSLEEKRQRRDTEKALIKNREDVEALYNRLRAKETYKYLPSLPTFRQLPVVKLLQAGVYLHGTTISDTLQENPLMRQQLDQDVERWTETAKQDLAVVLGFPRQWKSANKKVLHPVERVTARFLCTKCGVDGTDRRMNGCLNFAAACLHVCQGKNGKNDRYRRSKKAAWNPGNFVKDEKAINVLKSAMSILKMSEEIDKSFDLAPYGHAVLCNSCEPSMLLHTRNMVGHCHRHDSMQISFLPRAEGMSYLNGFPLSCETVTKFFRQGGKAIQEEINMKKFGCRICLRKKQVNDTSAVPGSSANPAGDKDRDVAQNCSQPKNPKPPLFNFNGLRSHLKAKHRIENIRDEDFFCSQETIFS